MKQFYAKVLINMVFLFGIGKMSAQTISNVNPSIGMEGTTINVSISGQNSNFQQGTTTVWFNQGSSTIYASSVNVSNNTNLVAQVGIPYGTPLGLYQTNVQDPIDNTISLGNSFTVVANPNAPVITNVNPSSTMEGTALNVSISGQNTNFQQGTTTVWFNQGSSTIYASNVNVNSLTSLDAFFNIPFGTPLGLYDTNVQDPVDNTVTSPNSFTITANPNAPDLVSVMPNNGNLGTTIPVNISGQNTNFLQGTGTLVFVQGSSTLITSNLLFNSNTDLGATLTIPSNAYPGYYDVYFTNALDGTMLLVSGFYVNPPPCGNITLDISQQPCPGGTATISISGGFAPYTMAIDGQTISVQNPYLDYAPPAIGNYLITSLLDNFGCPATTIDSLIVYDEFSGTISGPTVCVGTPISLVSNIVSSAAITSIYYYYGTGGAGINGNVTYNAAGTYYPSMNVTNSNGCNIYVTASSPVIILPAPQDSIINLSNANCGLTNGAFEITGMGNGPFSYNITGVGGYTSTNTVNSGLSAGTYNINITDSNGCVSDNLITIANVSNLTSITGNIQTATGTNANNTIVKLFSLSDTIAEMAVSYTTLTDANGNYSFSNLAEDNYILRAEPDTALFPDAMITYSNGSAVWFNSDTIQVNCTSQQVVDITINSSVLQIGTAEIGGFIADYNFSMLPYTGIVLYDDNNSQSVARTNTDAAGNYNFLGVNAGHYSLFVDIPGLVHTNNYSFGLNSNDILWDKSNMVNFTNRTIDTLFITVGVNEISIFESSVYPNPFSDQTTIKYTLPETSKVTIELYNYLGERLETLVNEVKTSGNYQTLLTNNNKAKGIYFLRITAGNKQKTIKVINID